MTIVLVHGAIQPQRADPCLGPPGGLMRMLVACNPHRLGKFLANVDALRKTRLDAPHASLEWLAAGGECVYYFTEQLTW